jgi:alcohol dehydrogenase class IV
MIKPFRFATIPNIIFGSGKIAELPGIIKKAGNPLLLVTGKNSFNSASVSKTLLETFDASGIICYRLIISGEPSPTVIDNAVREFRDREIKMIASIGGGSVIDAGKAVSAMMFRQDSIRDYLEGVGNKEHPGTKLPFIAVPTTSGTGSEATKNAVISEVGRNGFKRSLRHDNFVPDIAIVDPELTLSCSRDITATSGMDCFTQLTEAYLSDKANNYTDALALEGLKAIKSSLVKCYIEGSDPEARNGMSFAALTSGICIANAGLGVVHGFASSLGGMHDIPHGIICGSLMAISNEVNVRELRKKSESPALRKYASLGRIFFDETCRSDDYYIDGFIHYLHKLTDELDIPRLGQFGIKNDDIMDICLQTDGKNNPLKLSLESLIEIMSRRI